MYHVPLAVKYIHGCSHEGGNNEDGKDGRELGLPGLLYVDDLVLCGELEEDLRVMVGRFVEGCRRGLKVNASKRKVMVLGGMEGLECEVCVDRIRLEHVSEFIYLECVLDESGTDEAEYSRKMGSGRRVAGTIRSVFNTRSLQFDCARVLHESLLVPGRAYGRETIVWREKERSRIRAVKMDNLRSLLGIKRMDKVPNAQIRQLCGVTKGAKY